MTYKKLRSLSLHLNKIYKTAMNKMESRRRKKKSDIMFNFAKNRYIAFYLITQVCMYFKQQYFMGR